MTGIGERRALIAGYEAPIYQAVWKRILMMAAPRRWAGFWLALCLYGALIFLSVLGGRWAVLPLVVWAVGQGVLVLLTLWDVFWDDIAIAQLTRRYKAWYEAG